MMHTDPLSQLYTPKEKMADFLESYAILLDINVWTNSNVTNAEYDPTGQQWTIEVERNAGSRNSQKSS
jgi:cation diffusion facilitator CzcD-associated flavoprotein CzcO